MVPIFVAWMNDVPSKKYLALKIPVSTPLDISECRIIGCFYRFWCLFFCVFLYVSRLMFLKLTPFLQVVIVSAWSADLHRIVAKVASSLLTERAGHFVSVHLTGLGSVEEAMVSVADWADYQPESDEYHFSHTPYRDCSPYDHERDCRDGRCLVTGLLRYFNEASSYEATPQQRTEALKYLIHLVADATQPLHVGFKEDAGGNKINLAAPYFADLSLHELWDSGLFEWFSARRPEAMRHWSSIADSQIIQKITEEKKVAYRLPRDFLALKEPLRSIWFQKPALRRRATSRIKMINWDGSRMKNPSLRSI